MDDYYNPVEEELRGDLLWTRVCLLVVLLGFVAQLASGCGVQVKGKANSVEVGM